MCCLHSMEEGSWFKNQVTWKIGSDNRAKFWENGWKEDGVPLLEKYPRLYCTSKQQQHYIQQMGSRQVECGNGSLSEGEC